MIHGGALTLVIFGLAGFLLFAVRSQGKCSKTCIQEDCNSVAIRYGKYCGIGYYGCRGEAPCDDLDVCCMTHDTCVGLKGMTYVNCHIQFKHCVNKLNKTINQSTGQKVGFSKRCPYKVVIPTVYKGMDYGIFFSKIGNILKPPGVGSEPVVEANLDQSKADTKDGLGTNKPIQIQEGSKVSASLN
ncbi:unnamed protein product [Arabis nemorensis]|uniref:Phospholipase A2 domain-containing protein n=1 Tax=Arabis nemorensis TaxID=586526 RepID=A0A565CC65_9BRAS|nr:unnamed protein product [Arabis nemorensis]